MGSTINKRINALLPEIREKLYKAGRIKTRNAGPAKCAMRCCTILGVPHLGQKKRMWPSLYEQVLASTVPIGVRPISAQKFYASRAWLNVRYEALVKYGGRCQCCGANGNGVVLHVDHIKPRSKYPQLALEISNLQILCEACNMGKGALDETDWRG